VRFKTGINEAYHEIQSYEGAWNTGVEFDADGTPNRGYRTRIKGGYFPVSPTDQFADLRDEMVMELGRAGLLVERSHHEVGTAGQMEINYRFSDILQAGDDVMKFKYIIRNVAWEGGKTATFMPKPLFGDNGSGMHVHLSQTQPLTHTVAWYQAMKHQLTWFTQRVTVLLVFVFLLLVRIQRQSALSSVAQIRHRIHI